MIIIQGVVLLLLVLAAILYISYRPDPSGLLLVSCWSVVAVTVYAFLSWYKLTGSLFDPYSLFLVSATLFNGSLAFLEVLGLNQNGILANRFTADTTLRALWLTAMGMAGMHLGALIGTSTQKSDKVKVAIYETGDVSALRRAGFLLLTISVIPTVLVLIQAVAVAIEGGYFALYQQAATTGIVAGPQILAYFFVPAVLCLLASGKGSARYLTFCTLLIVAYSAVQLLLGARYGATAPLLAYAWVWHRSVRRLSPRFLMVAAALLLLVVFPLIGQTRDVNLAERVSASTELFGSDGYRNPGLAAITEMGGSLRTVAYTVELVPAVRAYDFGRQYVYSMLTVIPNVFGGVHPSVARGTPTQWLVNTVDPGLAAAGGGLGYSYIAEAYLNFGFWGAPLALFLIGLLYIRFVSWGTSNDLVNVVAVASFLSFFLVFARGDSTNIMRPLVWYSILVYILARALQRGVRQ